MEICVINRNIKLTAVYYNGGESPHLFKIRTNVTLSGLKDELDQINRQLNHIDTRRVDGVDYRRPSIDSIGTPWFSQMKLASNDYVRTMLLIFGQYITKWLIELDDSLVRSVEEIQKSLIRPKNYKEITALLEEPDEEISLADPWSIRFYFIMYFMLLNYVVKINISMVSLWTRLLSRCSSCCQKSLRWTLR